MKKPVAVLNMTRMGDLLMTGPMLTRLRDQWPGHELHLIAVDGFLPIAVGMDVDRVISIDFDKLTTLAVHAGKGSNGQIAGALNGFRDVLRDLQSIEYEAIYNISHTRISAILATLLKGSVQGGLHLDGEGFRRIEGRWARNWFSGNLNRGVNPFHLVDMNIGIAGGGCFPVEKRVMKYAVTEAAKQECADLLQRKGVDPSARIVAFQVGASKDDKRWESEKFGSVAKSLADDSKIVPVFVGTKSELNWATTASTVAGPKAVVVAGETSLPVLAAVLERSALLITNDTGTMHLAQSVGTKSLDVTLGSALSDETGPYGAGNVIVEPDIACFPCTFDTVCAHHNCHKQIKASLVAKVAKAMLDDRPLTETIQADDLQGAHLWVTGFDRDGWWHKTPLTPKRLSESDIYRECYREVLKADLESDLRPEGVSTSSIESTLAFFDHDSINAAQPLLPEIDAGQRLLNLLEKAIDLAEKIQTNADSALDNVEALIQDSNALAEIDEQILQGFLRSIMLSPALALFRFDLENLPQEGIKDQSRSTFELHLRLKRLVSSLLYLVSGLAGTEYAGVEQIEQVTSEDIQILSTPAKKASGYEAFRRPRMRDERLNIILPTNGYYLQQEIATALTRLGHRVHPLPFEGRDDVIEQLLLLSRQADMLITVNHLGFDQAGELANLLDRIELPYVSWFVDRPAFILLDHSMGATEKGIVATWERSTIDEIHAYGFDQVFYLPLATDEKRFCPRAGSLDTGEIRWVANSMVSACNEWQEKAQLFDGDPLLDRAVALQRAGRLEPMEVLATAASAERIQLNGWDTRKKLSSASAIALTATRELRRELAREASGSGLTLYGDHGWVEIAPTTELRPPVEYPRGLVDVYRNSIHLNVTSYQMPTAVNQRVFDVPAAGGVLLTDRQESLGDLFDLDDECNAFNDLSEISEWIGWIRKHPDTAVEKSRRARERILNEHTYLHRVQYLLQQVRLKHSHASVYTAGGEVR